MTGEPRGRVVSVTGASLLAGALVEPIARSTSAPAYRHQVPRDRAALGVFLRSRRDRLTPAQAGMAPLPGPRRVPGLRKQELAVLAGLSPDCYSRLEQGRQANVSDEVLGALARALRLDDVEREHLHDLAAPARRARPVGSSARQRPDPGLLRIMGGLDHLPALLLGRRAEVLARNTLLTAVLGSSLQPGTSFLRYLFDDPIARDRIRDWPDFASGAVAGLRREAGRHPGDGRLLALIADLRARHADAARWWDDHGVRDYSSFTKDVAHPTAGALTFDVETVVAPYELDQALVVYTVRACSPTARVIPLLASWGAEEPTSG